MRASRSRELVALTALLFVLATSVVGVTSGWPAPLVFAAAAVLSIEAAAWGRGR